MKGTLLRMVGKEAIHEIVEDLEELDGPLYPQDIFLEGQALMDLSYFVRERTNIIRLSYDKGRVPFEQLKCDIEEEMPPWERRRHLGVTPQVAG